MRFFLMAVIASFILVGTLNSAPQINQVEWDEYESKDGGFSVRMPEQPVETHFEQKMDGKMLTGIKDSTKAGDYFVVSMDLPRAIRDDKERSRMIDSCADDWVRLMKGQQTSKLTVYQKQGMSGKSLTIVTGPEIILTNVFQQDKRVFFVTRKFPQRTEIDWWGSARFFTTFTVAGLPKPGETNKAEEPAVMPSFSKKPDIATVSSEPIEKNEGVLRANAAFLADALYSDENKSSGLRGKLTVDIQIDEYGVVTTAVARNGEPKLREAAEFAAHNCIFYPMKEKGISVKVKGVLTYTFGTT